MNYEDEMNQYEYGAEEVFDDFYGMEGVDPGYHGGYDNYAPQSLGRIDPNDRTYTVVVQNTGTSVQPAIVFGGNENAPQARLVTVEVEESSHQEVREESKSNPFKIVGLKMSVSNTDQFNHIFKIMRRTSSGTVTERKYQPRNAYSPQNCTENMIDDSQFEMDVTGQDSLRFDVEPGVKVVFTFTVRARANMGNVLGGRNVAETSNDPRVTGLPQIDLMQGRPYQGMPPARPAYRPRPLGRPAVRPSVPPRTNYQLRPRN